MRAFSVLRASALVALAVMATAVSAQAVQKRPVVVELFTSQGCSSCPPANANLVKLRDRSDVLSLSFSVTYWDRLGWKDVFGRPEFTDRQAAYEPGLRERGSFTPQMVVNGRASGVGADFADVERLIAKAGRLEGPDVMLGASKVEIGGAHGRNGPADVWMVRYDARIQETAVRRGENSGRTLPHSHVVTQLRRLGSWTGGAVAFNVPPATGAGASKTAILVQEPAGPMLAAATD